MPLSPYAVSKLATESYALAHAACFGFGALAFRFFNVFGPLQAAGPRLRRGGARVRRRPPSPASPSPSTATAADPRLHLRRHGVRGARRGRARPASSSDATGEPGLRRAARRCSRCSPCSRASSATRSSATHVEPRPATCATARPTRPACGRCSPTSSRSSSTTACGAPSSGSGRAPWPEVSGEQALLDPVERGVQLGEALVLQAQAASARASTSSAQGGDVGGVVERPLAWPPRAAGCPATGERATSLAGVDAASRWRRSSTSGGEGVDGRRAGAGAAAEGRVLPGSSATGPRPRARRRSRRSRVVAAVSSRRAVTAAWASEPCAVRRAASSTRLMRFSTSLKASSSWPRSSSSSSSSSSSRRRRLDELDVVRRGHRGWRRRPVGLVRVVGRVERVVEPARSSKSRSSGRRGRQGGC